MERMKIKGGLKLQNFKTLETVRGELEVRQGRKDDAIIPFSNIRYIGGNMVAVKDDAGQVRGFNPTLTGWKQILREAEIPADFFLDKMTIQERQQVFNRLVALNDGQRMLRMDANTIYGCVSSKYKPIDNISVMEVVESSTTPLVMVNGSSIHYDHSKFRFVPERYVGNVGHGTHLPMCEILNSENGMGSFRVVAGVYTVLCTNGLVVPIGDMIKTRFYHKGTSEIQFPDLGQVLNYAERLVAKMEQAERIYVDSEYKVKVINKALSAGLSHETINGVIATANSHYHNGRCLSDVVGAFTQYAQVYIDGEAVKRTAIEEFAGQLLLKAA